MQTHERSLWRSILDSLTGRNNIPQLRTESKGEGGYRLCKQRDFIDETFDKLTQTLRQHTLRPYGQDAGRFDRWPTWHFERGRIEPGRRYFYLKAQNQQGWLFERSGAGWVIARCEKIHDRDLFLRSYEAWDIVSIFSQGDPRGFLSKWRVNSSHFGGGLLVPSVYESKLIDAISEDSLRVAS